MNATVKNAEQQINILHTAAVRSLVRLTGDPADEEVKTDV